MKTNLEQLKKETSEINYELLEKVDYNDMLFCIAKTLIDYRNIYNYSQKDIANKLDVTQVMISKIESGKYNLSIKFLVNLWNKLSTENFNFSEIVLNNMLKKAKENYDIKYNISLDEKYKNNKS